MSARTNPSAKKARLSSNMRAVAREADILAKERQDSRAPQMQYEISKRRTRISSRNPLNEFVFFPKLPLELRLMIWAMAEPTPAIVAQRKSGIEGRAYYYLRSGGVPAVLHVCQESRQEYLEIETNDKVIKAEIEYRRRKHPIYKLCFRTHNKLSPGVYFSVDVDTFWPATKGRSRARERAVLELSNAGSLKYLAITASLYKDLGGSRLIDVISLFPSLETMTILADEAHVLEVNQSSSPLVYKQEVDGRWNTSGIVLPDLARYARACIFYDVPIIRKKFPEKSIATIKFRFERQFIRAENLDIPEFDKEHVVAETWTASRLRTRE